MIKPDAVENGHIGAILEKINSAGFKIIAMKLTKLTKEKAEEFYEVHNERPFYGELVSFMSRGPIVAAILEKNNAVEEFRKLIGSTNPSEAAEGTIRNLYATSMGENAVHGSDSNENAEIEITYQTSLKEIVNTNPLPLVEGEVDIYSHQQAWLIASENLSSSLRSETYC